MTIERFHRFKRFSANVFILAHLVILITWAMPASSVLMAEAKLVVAPYLRWGGLFQSWDMFAPEPRRVNSFLEAQVTFADGQNRTWAFPRMEQLSYRDRYFRERYRKFAEYVIQDAKTALWPDVARKIARINYQKTNPPTVVILIRYWADMLPPGRNLEYRTKPWQGKAFYMYLVKPEDLR